MQDCQENDCIQTTQLYTSYQELPQIPADTNMGQIIQVLEISLNDKKNWMGQFNAITSLRAINKQYSNQVNDLFMKFGMQLLQLADCNKTSIQKNLIMMLQEIFMQFSISPTMDPVISSFVPLLINKSRSEKSIIKAEAQVALTFFVQNCNLNGCAYRTICQLCFDKNKENQEKSIIVLGKLIQLGGMNFTKLDPQTLQIIMKSLTQLLNGQRNIVEFANQICNYIGQLVGQENYMALIQNTLSQEEQQQMIKQIIENNNKDKVKQSIKKEIHKESQMIKNDKQNHLQQQMQQNNYIKNNQNYNQQYQQQQYQNQFPLQQMQNNQQYNMFYQ